ncbi:alpha/beta fold hydrolase [Pseudonocardia alni]|jgi:pimeloyl-ACP methyl ester carboxylesterase|uniref:Pimeloyl-ACP methyl ester carboxylesterase n=1 Tax=Pseudonocardia alni TaxID=33907 RepID=A0A852W7S8_PSEA5|nr:MULTISPECIES: alpha/beta fold hydrolase [Pseudonocardia]OJG08122.1 4,5:9,10-diseco-3-hydroxy-5,9,17-trioxoandrosta-1(10),2-diene-4-oate hydrolase [Pseudonocardia autotrophica]MCO7195570.1 alpha/beta fold hydrolase [Pseudonocardia sp. McavD-2-B]MYW70835.1 alpha/beta fold hydrolase [Pseudonocardia sp. SID8383]NYG04620.1 pimeloyl-ACP methyl ester carboxylesterase [Pseudonocardia antarctica]PKB29867.1 pimeloyl-ACP methyl ester carboxylesterase [Pseudonocardia alni]
MSAHHVGGSGEPLLLLHGMTSSWRAWKPLLPMLEEHHEVWAVTMPGHLDGPSMPEGEFSMDLMVDALVEELDALGVPERPHVVGNSLGGWAALELARRGRARSVVGLSPAGAWSVPSDLYRLLVVFRLGALLAGWAPMRTLASCGAIRRLLLLTVAEHADRYTADEVAELFDDLAGCTILEPLLSAARMDTAITPFEQLPCPVRVAWAGSDRTIPYGRYGRPLMDAVPGAELVVLPGVGHVPMVDNPALVAWTILQHTRYQVAS